MLATIAPATGGEASLPSALCGPALDAAQCQGFAAEITAQGRGATVYHALANEGTVLARDLAAWLCLERSCSRVRLDTTLDGALCRTCAIVHADADAVGDGDAVSLRCMITSPLSCQHCSVGGVGAPTPTYLFFEGESLVDASAFSFNLCSI